MCVYGHLLFKLVLELIYRVRPLCPQVLPLWLRQADGATPLCIVMDFDVSEGVLESVPCED